MRVRRMAVGVACAVMVNASASMDEMVPVSSLGVTVRDMPMEKTKSINDTMGYFMGIIGVDVVSVAQGSPASAVGLEGGMIVTAIRREAGGRTILNITPTSGDYFARLAEAFNLGDTITLSVWTVSAGNSLARGLPGAEEAGKWYRRELRFNYVPFSNPDTVERAGLQNPNEQIRMSAPLVKSILLRALEKATDDREELVVSLATATLTGGGSIAPIMIEHLMDIGLEILAEEGILDEEKVYLLRGAMGLLRAVNGLSDAEDVLSALNAVRQAYAGLVDIGLIDDVTDQKVRVRLSAGSEALSIAIILGDVEKAKYIGQATLEEQHGLVARENWTSPTTGMEFVWIRQMNMWVGKHEVTNAEYRRKEPGHDSQSYEGRSLNGDRQPVVQVNYDDGKAYATWLTERERAAGRIPEDYRYRLPTGDEWMTFVQCGDGREYPWGNNWPPRSGQAGNYADGTAKQAFSGWTVISGYTDGHAVTAPVDALWENPWGLKGVGGNVWEVTSKSAGGDFDAWRGASWGNDHRGSLRCSFRDGVVGSGRISFSGFRLVLVR